MDNKKLWESVLAEIELEVSKANFHTWFKDTHITKQDEGTVYLSVPNAFVKDWLFQKYHKSILKSLRNYGEDVRALEYSVSKDEGKKRNAEINQRAEQSQNTELPLADYYINKEDNLNPKYTFDSFVVGPFNELAHAAAQAILKNPGRTYSPLFLYGNTGHGKTHLLQAIGNSIKATNPNAKIFYVTSEKFTIDYINSVQNNKPNQFKEKYRKYDLLIMDDIQFLSKKTQTQEELFHLFNALTEYNKQIVFSSDKHPNYIPDLEERLKSRFGAGMIVEIQPPDYESRVAILKTKSEQNGFHLAPEVIDYLASSVEGNIRDLEGVLNGIVCQTQLKNQELSLSDIKNLIKNSAKPKKNVSSKEIIKIITDFYNIEEGSVYEKTRKKGIVKPRQLIMYILREDFNVSYPSIGQKLGGRDHTTVMHSCEKIKNELKVNQLLAQELSQDSSPYLNLIEKQICG